MTDNLSVPTFIEERKLAAWGYRFIAGIDEVGRGALAGPVVAAAVILPCQLDSPWLKQVRDSKQLTPQRREVLCKHIREEAVAIGIGMTSPEEIDNQGIYEATRLTMLQATSELACPPNFVLIDGMSLPKLILPQKKVIGGDRLCLSIACASIIAKVHRDRLMVDLDSFYPGYGLAKHKGYGTKEHFANLQRLGPSPIHRRSFSPLRDKTKHR